MKRDVDLVARVERDKKDLFFDNFHSHLKF